MKKLDKEELIKSAEAFCKQESGKYRKRIVWCNGRKGHWYIC